MKEEEEEERLGEIIDTIEDIIGDSEPITSAQAVQARKEFVMGHYRQLMNVHRPNGNINPTNRNSTSSQQDSSSNSIIEAHEQQQLNRPNLDIPTQDGSYMTLAQ